MIKIMAIIHIATAILDLAVMADCAHGWLSLFATSEVTLYTASKKWLFSLIFRLFSHV